MSARFPMVKVAEPHTTTKDFRDYPTQSSQNFTRIHDADLLRMWNMLNELYGVFSHPNFTDRHGHADRIKAILTYSEEGNVGDAAALPIGTPDRLDIQNKEFTAARAFAEALRIHDTVAVVDDGYPEVRRRYESRVKDLIDAFRKNGRIL